MDNQNPVYAQLERSLVALLEDPKSLRASLVELDTLLGEHRLQLPAKLIHYLERRSYAKALAYLRALKLG